MSCGHPTQAHGSNREGHTSILDIAFWALEISATYTNNLFSEQHPGRFHEWRDNSFFSNTHFGGNKGSFTCGHDYGD